MSDLSVLAAEYPVHINTGTSVTPVWTEIKGIQTETPSPSSKAVDTGTFTTVGWDRERVVSRGLSVSLEGIAEYDDDERDPGQAALIALGEEVGAAAEGEFLIHLGPSGDGLRFFATAEVTSFGGSKDGVAAFKAELKVTAQPTVGVLA